jgi:hypothetical protein
MPQRNMYAVERVSIALLLQAAVFVGQQSLRRRYATNEKGVGARPTPFSVTTMAKPQASR